ncbi:hypothetical protein [Micromonospora endolithica]|uniref:Uncharacterized protein n=1 Tax=Micromonospora endolithica TaxID=230091 RepID=A0A3A9ZAC2_9ACTN|nr:hypothetical protein [Micromonospora endolithica]RKN45412.1 hypothetical protein D7223_17575 [Micromonospora endolithica]TWJ22871.1 hypothetical protein JD76_02994 [Micromonospora endolithica]
MSDPIRSSRPPRTTPGSEAFSRLAGDSLARLAEDALRRSDTRLPADAPLVDRRDERADLLAGRFVHRLTGLAPSRRIGPFRTPGGTDVFYHVFLAARRVEVREVGATAPALVLTAARPGTAGPGGLPIALDAGTLWIRGDLVGGLPADAYAGLRVDGGTLTLPASATVTGDVITVPAPLSAALKVAPAADAPPAGAGGCTAADASTTLPGAVSLRFGSGGPEIGGDSGEARVWRQPFRFGSATGDTTFVPRLWTLVLGYDVEPDTLDPTAIGAELVRFGAADPATGVATVRGGGLGLPVVVATDPAILGEAASAARWLLHVTGLTAHWYDPDPRAHELPEAWAAVSAAGAMLVADQIAPLSPPVRHAYDLWALPDGGHRLPWWQRYDRPFFLLHSCHVVDGEHLMTQGGAEVALDRPVTTAGEPVPTPARDGVLLLHRLGDEVTALLGATLAAEPRRHLQLALRNALVWTTWPTLAYVRGVLRDGRSIGAGAAHLLFGVHGWAPILPDPYVANATVTRPRIGREPPPAALVCTVAWTAPDAPATVDFEGQLGPSVAVSGRPASSGEPRPADADRDGTDVGLTQVEQGRLGLDKRTDAEWDAARRREQELRGQRVEVARQSDAKSNALVDRYLDEVVGPTPGLLLLDVSTNQDLLGVAMGPRRGDAGGPYGVDGLEVRAEVADLRVVALPQVQWEPVRTLDADQDIMTMGWFPTPLASASDGGATTLGARSQKLVPVVPADALDGTVGAFRDGVPVGLRTTLPFGLVAAVVVRPDATAARPADLLDLTRPAFPAEDAVGGIQVTAWAEGGRSDDGGVSAAFDGRLRQLLNGVDLASGAPLGLSVLGSTADPTGSVESVFNNDMAANPKVPVTRIDVSGYGGSNFSDWNNPFAAFAEAAKVQFRLIVGRTALEVIKVNSVLHPWGIRVTRSVTVERRPGGGVIRRDSGWQAFTPGLFDYRYHDKVVGDIVVAPYAFDAGLFRGLFDVRSIRPAPGAVFGSGGAQLVPYHFDADLALDGLPGRTPATGVLGWLQVTPNGVPAPASALRALIEAQGPVGGPVDAWIDVAGSGLPYRAQRIEVGLADDGGTPLFVATVRGMPRLPETGAWSVVVRPVAGAPPGGGEAVPVAENRGTSLVRRYPIGYAAGDRTVFTEPPLVGAPGAYRFADAADLLVPAAPAHDYALVQSTPTHAFCFPRPSVPAPGVPRIESGARPALADVLARTTSKGAFPPPANTIELAPGAVHLDVGAAGRLALSAPVEIVDHPTPLRIAGSTGHGAQLRYDDSTLRLELTEERWSADFTGLRVWNDIAGMTELTGSELHIAGGTDRRPEIVELRSLLLTEIEEILRYIPFFGDRGVEGPIPLGATNAKHEVKFDAKTIVSFPKFSLPIGAEITATLSMGASSGIDLATGGAKASGVFGAELEGKFPVLSVGVVQIFIIASLKVTFSITSVSGSVTSEKFELVAFVGVGVEGNVGVFRAYAFLGVGFVLVYDAIAARTSYGGLVAFEAGVDITRSVKIVKVKLRAELRGLVYDDAGTTKCDYTGSVKLQVDIFLIISISATYQVTDTVTL